MKAVRHNSLLCPYCGEHIDAAGHVITDLTEIPDESMTICVYCLCVSVFVHGLDADGKKHLGIRPADGDEVAEFMRAFLDDELMLRHFTAFRARIKASRQTPGAGH